MRKILIFFIIVLTCNAGDGFASVDCPFLPAFQSMRKQLDTMPVLTAISTLQKYFVENENPQACELFEINRLLGQRESPLIKLKLGAKEIAAQVVFRCNEFDPVTAQCQSPMNDDTVHYFSNGAVPLPFPEKNTPYRVISELPATQLIGLYQTSLASALDGKPARRLGDAAVNKWRQSNDANVLFAIYKTQGPWRYRKAVWYFK